MSWTAVADVLAAACLLVGAFFALVASLGVVRLPDLLSRMHAATKPQVIGLMLVVTGLALRLREPGVLGFLALVGGLVQVPGVDDVIGKFLEPVFANSPLSEIHPSVSADWVGLGIGGVISVVGIALAYFFYVAQPATPAILIRRLPYR